MGLTARPTAGEDDWPRIADLIRAARATSRHLVDYPWRLSSPSAQPGEDCHIWLDGDGAAVGLACWQTAWAALDFYARPGPLRRDVEDAIFAWAEQRFRELDAERGHPLPYWAEAREDDADRLALLARHGYVIDDGHGYVLMQRPLAEPVASMAAPPGFAIRPLAGEGEVEAYVAVHRRAFESATMAAPWRARTLRWPQHRPALDLVAVAPDGRLAGFCVGWLDAERRVAQIEPFGVDPDYRNLGLGRALLVEMLARCRSHGAGLALVETVGGWAPAVAAYEAVGFRVVIRAIRKGRWFSARRHWS